MSEAVQEVSKGKLLAFRIVAGILGVLMFVSIFYMFQSLSADNAQHRFHNFGPFGPFILLLGVPLVMLAFRPREVLAFRVALASAAGLTLGYVFGRDFSSGENYIVPVVMIGLVVLYPWRAEVFRLGEARLALAALSILGAVPAIVYAWHNGKIQPLVDPATDPTGHWKFHHWSGIAGAALSLVIVGLVLSFRREGDRTWTRQAGLSAALFGIAGLVFSGKPSAPSTVWASVVLLGGAVYASVAEVSAG